MEYSLVSVREHRGIVREPSDPAGEDQFELAWAFDLDIQHPTPDRVAVRVTAEVHATPSAPPQIIDFSATHTFEITGRFKPIDELTESSRFFGFYARLTGVSLGTMRGLVYARAVSVFAGSLVMPVVNPSELLKHYLEGKRVT